MEKQAFLSRPILFSAPMVRAILAGTKTQTRRVVKQQITPLADGSSWHQFDHRGSNYRMNLRNGTVSQWSPLLQFCPYGQPGDRLWVREAWMDLQGTGIERVTGDPSRYAYAADTPPGSHGDECRKNYGLKWRPSIHMPRSASRITLEITSVRVERLQDISEPDAQAEGCALGCMTPTGDDSGSAIYGPGGYLALWESINGPSSWEANPWVWVVEFKRVEGGEK